MTVPCVYCRRPVDVRASGDGFWSTRGAAHDTCHREAVAAANVPAPSAADVPERAIPNLVLLG